MLGVEIDGYVLSDGTPCISERGAAKLLGFSTFSVLQRAYSNSWPKELKPFIPKGFECTQTFAKVIANCPHKGSSIHICNAQFINTIARAYSQAYLHCKLRKNQLHIGLHCATLRDAMADTALEQIIFDACRYKPHKALVERADSNYQNALHYLQESGFKSSLPNVATKKDLVNFLRVPQSTLNSFLSKHSYQIKPIKLDRRAIQQIGCRASRMNGYELQDVVKVVFGMDTEVTIALKRRMFGELGTFAKMDSRNEIEWREILRDVFSGFELRTNYPIGQYRYYVDYFIPVFSLCLEENGYDCHQSYDTQKEQAREKIILEQYGLIRFHHKISVAKLFNAILKIVPGQIIKLYDIDTSVALNRQS
ncbi:hypothetical protein [Candidatus Uabimicrobium sp. HlEnr_7]|uniref:hypothetical protein n=1 Tax=Candidatus Uabimicrobium helgolandensis TaxID=3095367 RepID=UPI003556202A